MLFNGWTSFKDFMVRKKSSPRALHANAGIIMRISRVKWLTDVSKAFMRSSAEGRFFDRDLGICMTMWKIWANIFPSPNICTIFAKALEKSVLPLFLQKWPIITKTNSKTSKFVWLSSINSLSRPPLAPIFSTTSIGVVVSFDNSNKVLNCRPLLGPFGAVLKLSSLGYIPIVNSF